MVVNPSAGESSLSVSILPTQTTAYLSQFTRSSCEAAIGNRDTIWRKWMLNQCISNLTMTNRSIGLMSLLGILSTWIYPHQVAAQTATGTIKNNPTTYEDDKIKVVIQDCNRKLQDLICQATLTSKNSDRPIDLNSTNIKLIDAEGNEYYPSILRLANRTSANNSIKAELVENVPFKASFVFAKIPTSVTRIALFQMPIGGINATAKFRNLVVVEPNTAKSIPMAAAILPVKPTKVSTDSKDNSLICPDNTKILYRATSKHYRMYICGNQNPTHYVGHSKDGSEGITLRLRYYDRSRFSADNGDTNYTIAANKLIISKDSKVIYQEKIEVTQPLLGTVAATEEAPAPVKKSKKTATVTEEPTPIKTKPKKTTSTPAVTTTPKRKSTERSTTTTK